MDALELKTIKVAAAAIVHQGRLLITQRKNGFWELPGGKVESGETFEQCCIREIKEELDLDIKINSYFGDLNYTYPDFKLEMKIYTCSLIDPNEKVILNVHQNKLWAKADELPKVNWLPADLELIPKLQALL